MRLWSQDPTNDMMSPQSRRLKLNSALDRLKEFEKVMCHFPREDVKGKVREWSYRTKCLLAKYGPVLAWH